MHGGIASRILAVREVLDQQRGRVAPPGSLWPGGEVRRESLHRHRVLAVTESQGLGSRHGRGSGVVSPRTGGKQPKGEREAGE